MTRDELVTFMSADMFTLEELLDRPAWHPGAACRDHPEVDFFRGRGVDTRPAKAVCAGCDVRAEYLAAAQEDQRTQGIWGGTSDVERKRLRRHAA